MCHARFFICFVLLYCETGSHTAQLPPFLHTHLALWLYATMPGFLLTRRQLSSCQLISKKCFKFTTKLSRTSFLSIQ